MTPEQSRAARGWLGWLQTDLAKAATVSVRTVAAFERGEIIPLPNNLSAMQRAFEKAGLRLLFDREGAAAGVARQAADIELTHRRSE
jgi:ribosome-binding protein aMBF1 (putative translation factor)